MSDKPDTRLAEEGGGGAARPLPSETAPRSAAVDIGGLVIAGALLLLAFMIYSDAASYPVRSASAHFGPSVYPMMVAAALAVIGAATVWMGIRGRFPERETMVWGPPLWITGGLVAQIVLIVFGGGFSIATSALFAFAAKGLGRSNLLINFLAGLVVTSLLYILFQRGLGLALPIGPVERAIAALLG